MFGLHEKSANRRFNSQSKLKIRKQKRRKRGVLVSRFWYKEKENLLAPREVTRPGRVSLLSLSPGHNTQHKTFTTIDKAQAPGAPPSSSYTESMPLYFDILPPNQY